MARPARCTICWWPCEDVLEAEALAHFAGYTKADIYPRRAASFAVARPQHSYISWQEKDDVKLAAPEADSAESGSVAGKGWQG